MPNPEDSSTLMQRYASAFKPQQAKNAQRTVQRSGSYGKIAPYSTNSVLDDQWAVHFPNIQEEIELSRSAEYKVIPVAPYPDGIHRYMHTNPMEIPVSFELHGFDSEYCTDGPIMLLRVAAILHSLTLPIKSSQRETGDPYAALQTQTGTDDAAIENTTQSTVENTFERADSTGYAAYNQRSQKQLGFAFPVPCYMELLKSDAFSIACSGYVKSVSVKLRGPWISYGNSKNLPTSAQYSFVFVHNPMYTNDIMKSGEQQWSMLSSAMAQDVAVSLYNTQQRIRTAASGVSTIGLS